MTLQWQNWAGNQRATVSQIETPATEAELAKIIEVAASQSQRVKVVGSGHSFTGIARPDEALVDLSNYRSVLSVDRQTGHVTVQAGITIAALNKALDAVGLAMPNLGDIDKQTIAGAISTGTHGTGLHKQTIAAGVVGLRLIDGTGRVVIANADENPDLLRVARVGLGAIGVISEVTLVCVAAFSLEAVEQPENINEVLESFEERATASDHFEFFWFPHTNLAMTKANNRVPLVADTRPTWKRLLDEEIAGNFLFGAVTKAGQLRPSLTPKLARRMESAVGRSHYQAPSHVVFTSPRRNRFVEMEYNVPVGRLVEVFREVQQMIDGLDHPVSYPIEVRVLAADDIPLSPAFERTSAYLAFHLPAGQDPTTYFARAEQIMTANGGRPHWGKMHTQTAHSLANLYPEFDAFINTRDLLDPNGTFTNDYLVRVLGR